MRKRWMLCPRWQVRKPPCSRAHTTTTHTIACPNSKQPYCPNRHPPACVSLHFERGLRTTLLLCRYPLPSSVLMTACTARAAGVQTVWVASPHPDKVTMAAAHVAGVDGMLKVGGAQAVATMSQGIGE